MTWNLKVDIWKTSSVSWSTVDKAEDAIEDLADQLDTSTNIYRQGVYSGNDDHDTYEEYANEFKNVESHVEGRRSLLIYERAFSSPGGEGSEKYPNLGYSDEPCKHDAESYAIVNGNILETSLDKLAYIFGLAGGVVGDWFLGEQQEKIFENIVKHEFLHALLIEGNSPDSETEHAFGENNVYWGRNEASPMLTGYVVGTNDTPSPCCGGCSHGATDWTGTLSNCTKTEATRWLEEEYYSGDGGSDPCQPWDPLCP